jgi:hypothetical protein
VLAEYDAARFEQAEAERAAAAIRTNLAAAERAVAVLAHQNETGQEIERSAVLRAVELLNEMREQARTASSRARDAGHAVNRINRRLAYLHGEDLAAARGDDLLARRK